VLYRHSEVFRSLIVAADLCLVATAWLAAYAIRFHTGIPAPLGVPPLSTYLLPLVVILPLWLGLFRSHGLYEPQRTGSLLREAGTVLRATALGVMALVAINFFVREYFYSRGVVLIFSALSPLSVIALRGTLRLGLRSLRRRGYNLRYVLVVGAGRLAEETIDRIHAHPEVGLRVRGVLAEGTGPGERRVAGVDVVGGYGELKSVLSAARVDQVLIALPREESHKLDKVLADLDDEMVSIQLVPDLLDFLTLRSSVESLDGLPVICLRQSPLMGWAAVQKRAFDLVISGVGLLLAAPLIAGLAGVVVLTSGRPAFFRQQRMGLDGRTFRMWKLRTMERGAENETGPVWARAGDPRCTPFGRFLRRTSLDELPQLWNVLIGEMSLVGPRPEREVFIEEFRRELPGYMLRHKVKSGLTGWAQVHGWRGNTSLHERLEHDIYYIQNWSMGLDLRILLLTLVRWMAGKNAH